MYVFHIVHTYVDRRSLLVSRGGVIFVTGVYFIYVFRFEVCWIFCFNFVCFSRGMLTNALRSLSVKGAIVPSKTPVLGVYVVIEKLS